jgi:glucose-1-phosphate thymidylyltransferase
VIIIKGLILAGGHGTRLRPLTYSGNKHMLPVANKPIIFYGIQDLKNAGIKDIAIILGPVKEGVKEAIGDGTQFGLNIKYFDQPEPKGIAHAIGLVENFMGNEPFVVYLGDNILKNGIKEYVAKFQNDTGIDELLMLTHVNDMALAKRFGIAEIKNNRVLKVIEKPDNPTSDMAMIGVYFFRKIIFKAIKELKPSNRNELEVTEAIQTLIDWNCNVVPEFIEGWWKDTGVPENILDANRLILDDIKPDVKGNIDNSTIKGRVIVGENSVIRNGSEAKGPSIIGKNCVISGAYIGPYTSIGDNCIIENTEIEDSIVMESTRIINSGRIINSLIGKNVLIKEGNQMPKGKRLIIGDSSEVII